MKLPVWFGIAIGLFAATRLIGQLMRNLTPARIVLNQSALFGLIRTPLGVGLVLVIGIAIIVRMWQNALAQPITAWAVALIIVGALSNIFDRLVYGGVIDYISLFNFSTYNLADVEILVGALFLIVTPPADQSRNKDQPGDSGSSGVRLVK